ncbi:MAG: sigma 54-interacting transcriptional regulator, partial [Deltaproteobacteria bacterium]|nr:sigma 54-interacting transcriptional regulator [Deltaproteobacteria bacterium]
TRYDETVKLDRVVSFPEEARAWFGREGEEMQMQEVMIFNRPELHPITRAMTQLVGKPDTSNMIMRLEIQDRQLGALIMYVDRKDRYTRDHAALLSLLHDPLAIAMSNALKHEEVLKLKDMLADDNRYLHQELLRISGDEIIGRDGGLKGVMDMVRQVAPLNSPVLLLGETGVGKEVIANAIHYSSPRKNGPFIKVNCGAIPETLLDSELFGHEKGAFTGATARKRGRFERAHQGTIFLDEIGELPLQAQVRLLRVLQNKEIERAGGTTPIHEDIRIITATHRDLEDMAIKRQFREDLWFRLNVFPIMIPPLRERKEDIRPLVRHFVERKSREMKFHTPPALTPGAIDRLKDYHWQGNVRELENMVERALIQIRGANNSVPLTFQRFTLPQHEDEKRDLTSHDYDLLKLDQAMYIHIHRTLKLTNGKIYGPDGAAERLGINPNTLRSRMKKLDIQYKRRRSG